MEKLSQHLQQSENASRALSGVNGHMWANYMQSVKQTETVESASSFKFDKESGFYKDDQAKLFYDPETTYFFTFDHKKYFIYDHEESMLCLVDSTGQKVIGGERRPLPSQASSAQASSASMRGGRSDTQQSLSSENKSSEKTAGRTRSRSRSRKQKRSRNAEKCRETRHNERSQDGNRRGEKNECNRDVRHHEKLTNVGISLSSQEDTKHQPIHFPGGDPLARLAPPTDPSVKTAAAPKKKRRPPETVLGLAATIDSKILAAPGAITVSATRPGPVTVLTSTPHPPIQLQSTAAAAPATAFVPGVLESRAPAVVNDVLADWICEVCMRKFASEQALNRHEQLSELHRQNLSKLGLMP